MIYDELIGITDTILNYDGFKGEFTLCGRTFSEIDPNSRKGAKRTKNQRAAWIYQCLEADAMNKFIDYAKRYAGVDPLLTTHDCIYYKQKLPAETIKDITYMLREEYKYVQFEHEAVYPIRTEEDFARRFSDNEQAEMDHKQFIKEQEWKASGYGNNYAGPKQIRRQETDEEYEIRRHNQFLIDISMVPNREQLEDDDYYESPSHR